MDLDGDGHVDLLTGSWPGELFLFRGGPGRSFAPPEMIKDRSGEYINIGGGVKEEGDHLLITGNAEFEETAEGHFVNYHGERLKSTAEKPIWVTGTASAVFAADWDGDGDYDLLVGDIRGQVYLVPNEGTAREYSFGKERPLEAAGKPLKVEGDAGPVVADWDGDGRPDLLVGSGDGSVSLFRNIGDASTPKLAAAVKLVPPGSFDDDVKQPVRGIRSKLCVADWNGDGRLDLLVGDFATQRPDLPEPTAEEKAVHDKARAELADVRKEYSKLVQKLLGSERPKQDDELKELQNELKKLRESMEGLSKKLPPESENHGWVWLFLRKP